MSNLLILLNVISVLASNQAVNSEPLLSCLDESEITSSAENSILEDEEYGEYLISSYGSSATLTSSSDNDSISDAIVDPSAFLSENYPDCTWVINDEESGYTSDVSNQIPIEMQADDFPKDDVLAAIPIAGVEDKTSYGGCGPIALMGVLDYLARYLGYSEIIEDPTDSESRISLAAEVLSNSHFSIWGSRDESLVWPFDLRDCFNSVINNHGLSDIISATAHWTYTSGQKSYYWNQIVKHINQGLPVTFWAGNTCGDGSFARHSTNVYGYETWTGIPTGGGEKVTKTFLKARLNWGRTKEYYCDADILDCSIIAIIEYDINYENAYSFGAEDFAEEFVNSDGNGQYFYYSKSASVSLSNGKTLQTTRLRTSYIENQYLVMSPCREDAGTAYLDITFPNKVPKLSFSAAMWSSIEGALYEDFKLQYYDNGWHDHLEISPSSLPTTKDYPKDFLLLFPKNTTRIRFYATHSSPTGDRNKGRICLDDFFVEYNQ